MRSKGHRTVWESGSGDWESLEDMDWPDSSLEIDDDEFAKAIAEGRGEELNAA